MPPRARVRGALVPMKITVGGGLEPPASQGGPPGLGTLKVRAGSGWRPYRSGWEMHWYP